MKKEIPQNWATEHWDDPEPEPMIPLTLDPLALAREIKGRHHQLHNGYCSGFGCQGPHESCDAYRAAEELERVVGERGADLDTAMREIESQKHCYRLLEAFVGNLHARAEALAGEVERLKGLAEVRCVAHAAFNPPGDCVYCDHEQEMERAEMHASWAKRWKRLAEFRGWPASKHERNRRALEASLLRERGLRERVAAVIAEVHDMDQTGPAPEHRFAYIEEQLGLALTPPAPTTGEGKP